MNPRSTPEAPDALERLGFGLFRDAFAPHTAAGLAPARVVRTVRGHVWVATEAGVTRLSPAGNMSGADRTGDRPVVGDWVAVRPGSEGVEPVIEAILPRHSCVERGGSGKAAQAQVLAANIDTVFILAGLDVGPNPRRIERELALAWESGAVPVVVLSKADLIADPQEAIDAVHAIAPNVEVVLESAKTGAGMDELLAYTAGDRTVALIGPSGAGKSSLINRLVGGDVQAVAEVRAFDSKGRHTTVTRDLVPLPGGGALIDTPGLRGVAMWGEEEGVDTTFAEITELATRCRFDDCTHRTEPGCAVLAAVASGELPQERYDAFMALRLEGADQVQRKETRARAQSDRTKPSRTTPRERFRDSRGE